MTIGHFASAANVIGPREEALEFDLTAGEFLSTSGFSRLAMIGSLDPDLDFFEFGEVDQYAHFDTQPLFQIQINTSGIPDTDESWRFMTLTGDFGSGSETIRYDRADRDLYNGAAGGGTQTVWAFDPSLGDLIDTNVYACRVVRWL